MSKEYVISQEQLEEIEHYQRMFDLNASTISDLCDSEKDDVVYGFKLGQLYNYMRNSYIDMLELTTRIREQIKTQGE